MPVKVSWSFVVNKTFLELHSKKTEAVGDLFYNAKRQKSNQDINSSSDIPKSDLNKCH